MSALVHRAGQPAGDSQRPKSPKWRYVYFLLAAFDLVTVSAGLYLNYRIMGIYRRSVEVNRVWAERAAAYSHLGELASAVNAPGNDVFDTHDVQKELARMRSAAQAFDFELLSQRHELQQHLDSDAAAPLLARLDAVALAKRQMTEEASRIFDFFLQDRAHLAGQRMAAMDQKYASLNAALIQLRSAVSAIQQRNFAEQTAAAAELQRYEYAIALAIVLMVVGATVYGQKLAEQMQVDAEERERHLNALRAAESRTRSILDTAAEGIVSFDARGRIEGLNRAAERLFGEEPGASIGRDIRAMIPTMAGCLEAKAAESFADSETAGRLEVTGGEHVGIRRDETQFPLEFSVSRVDLGQTRTFTAIVRDISDRRRTEEAFHAAAAAQAANRAKSQFLANVSHEIRTPMSGVLGMAELLLETNLTPAQRRYAQSVHRSGESLLKIIDDILDFSKIEAGKLALDYVEFNPRDLVEEVAQLLGTGAERKGLTLVCRAGSDVPDTLRGASSRLRQVLMNLVGNAIKFTHHGRVAIVVSMEHRDADPTAAPVGPPAAESPTVLVRFAVEDTGIGIAASVQERLFRAFEQGDSSTTRSYGGTGLGLAISRELVERMGGRIGVRSMLGQGSEFWFTVPLDRPPRLELGPPRETNEAIEANRVQGVAPETFDPTALHHLVPNGRAAAPRMLAGLINHYVEDARKLMGALEGACDPPDAIRLAHAAQRLRTASELVGARKLGALCGHLERAARAAEPADLKPRIDAIGREYEAVIRAMQAFRPGR